jgi:alkylation response protein AidB-like acyl-CoA dehydrogenase
VPVTGSFEFTAATAWIIQASTYWRDTKLNEIGEGTSEVQKLVISREVLKKIV